MRILCALPVLASLALWARLELASGSVDLNNYLPKAPILLRAEILSRSKSSRPFEMYVATARLRVTRWYQGQPPPAIELRFAAGGLRMPGHNCFDFPPGTHWLILAKERDGALELIDDCYGAFRVSPELGAAQPDPVTQLEADFVAGLSSPYPSHRIINLQRLANLQSETSRPALHNVIATGTPTEKGWAIYAALRTGDLSALTAIPSLGAQYLPGVLAHEVSQIKDPAAIPALLEITSNSASPINESARTALKAIALLTKASAGIPFQGTYENKFGYGFRVTVPSGLIGLKTPPPAPQHGFTINLGFGAHISVDGSYNAQFFPTARHAAEAHAESLGDKQITPPRYQRTKLAGRPAVEITIQYRRTKSEAERERRLITALRPATPEIRYEILLDGPRPLPAAALQSFRAIQQSFRLTPLPE